MICTSKSHQPLSKVPVSHTVADLFSLQTASLVGIRNPVRHQCRGWKKRYNCCCSANSVLWMYVRVSMKWWYKSNQRHINWPELDLTWSAMLSLECHIGSALFSYRKLSLLSSLHFWPVPEPNNKIRFEPNTLWLVFGCFPFDQSTTHHLTLRNKARVHLQGARPKETGIARQQSTTIFVPTILLLSVSKIHLRGETINWFNEMGELLFWKKEKIKQATHSFCQFIQHDKE